MGEQIRSAAESDQQRGEEKEKRSVGALFSYAFLAHNALLAHALSASVA